MSSMCKNLYNIKQYINIFQSKYPLFNPQFSPYSKNILNNNSIIRYCLAKEILVLNDNLICLRQIFPDNPHSYLQTDLQQKLILFNDFKTD